jgi:hypothetical protein
MTAYHVKLTAAAWMTAGGVWIANGWLGLNALDGSRGFYVSEIVWLVVHALVLAGMVGLMRLTRTDTLSRRGFTIAVVGRAAFLVAEIAAIVVGKDELPLFPPAVALTAVGMIVGGAGLLRSRRWVGWQRFAPLAMGIYPLAAIIPVFAATGDRPNISVTLWGVPIFLVGVAVATATEPNRRAAGSPAGRQSESRPPVTAS